MGAALNNLRVHSHLEPRVASSVLSVRQNNSRTVAWEVTRDIPATTRGTSVAHVVWEVVHPLSTAQSFALESVLSEGTMNLPTPTSCTVRVFPFSFRLLLKSFTAYPVCDKHGHRMLPASSFQRIWRLISHPSFGLFSFEDRGQLSSAIILSSFYLRSHFLYLSALLVSFQLIQTLLEAPSLAKGHHLRPYG